MPLFLLDFPVTVSLYDSAERERSYAFLDFTLDMASERLVRGGSEIKLRPKSFQVLHCLVEQQGRLVTREELMQAVWGDVAVTDESISKCIAEIRKALDDNSQEIVRTVTRRGFLFQADVRIEQPTRFRAVSRQVTAFPQPGPTLVPRRPLGRRMLIGVTVLLAVAAGALMLLWPTRSAKQGDAYTQITHFTDSAVSPALSPDGRMLAFIRSDNWWLTPDQIWVKLLPNGEPVQVTHDPRPKYGLAFSPDGSRIAYTVAAWTAFTVSPFGGEPSKVLSNSAGVTWLNERQLLFSEVKTGVHMGLVTATENRSEYRQIYFPKDERGMVHLSYASPDRRWVLAVEMNPAWQPCRLVPLDGSSEGRQVGPRGRCTSAAWSPDGKWMYFGVEVDGKHHLWRQRFPSGNPEQITSGPTEEDGVAVDPDSRSLITSIGLRQSAVWIHDARGERPLSTEGYVAFPDLSGATGSNPAFSRDGKSLFYLWSESPGGAAELWRADLPSEKSAPVLHGVSILEYDVSDDGREVVFSSQQPGKPAQIWLAALEGRSPPRMISADGKDSPHFGPDGQILYRLSEGETHYLEQMKPDGSGRSRVVPYAVGAIHTISPDRRWVTTTSNATGGAHGGTLAVPVAGGSPRRICSGCPVNWAPDGKYVYLSLERESRTSAGKTLLVPLPPGETLPVSTTPLGMVAQNDPAAFPGSRLIDAFRMSPSPDPSVYAYVKTTVHRNLFRIPLHNN